MKNLILAISAAVMVSSVATSAGMARQASLGADMAIFASVPQRSGTTTLLAMGPTSAPQKPGGVGEGSSETPKVHKKAMHKHKHASSERAASRLSFVYVRDRHSISTAFTSPAGAERLSEVEDEVARSNHCPVAGGWYSGIGVAVERIRV
jgi:hypothetical protein